MAEKKQQKELIHQELRTFFHNKQREGTPLEQKLGSSAKVHAFAQFYQQNAEELAVIGAGALYEYTSDVKYIVDTKDVIAFKAGLSVMFQLLEDCYREIENKRVQESLAADDNPSVAEGP